MNRTRASSSFDDDFTAVAKGSSRSPLLDLREVRESGLPAVFLDYGEVLLYMDERLFSLHDANGPADPRRLPPPLPTQILETGVGIEYGWRHFSGCSCRFCGHREAAAA